MSDLEDAIKLAVLTSLGAWFGSYAKITLKSGEVVKPKLNELQGRVSEIIEWCDDNNRPIRIIILKPRQKGCSTISVGAGYHRNIRKKQKGAIIGGAYDQSANLMGILDTYAKEDEFDGGDKCHVSASKPITAAWKNGSTCVQMTANNATAGRSGTYQWLIGTEVAYWAEEGVSDAKKVLSGLLKCVGFLPETMVILESTAFGNSGDYHDRYQKAITFEEAKEGKAGYIKIFMPWFVFEDSRMKGENMHAEGIHSEDDYDDDERELAEEWNLDCEQVAWMRWALREECDDDMEVFKQDYPFDEETAFLKSGRGRFNTKGMKRQHAIASGLTPKEGVLEQNSDKRVVFRQVEANESMYHQWEQPKEGRRYLVCVDNMTGESQTGGDDTDSHGVKVLRAGYMDRYDGWIPPAIVCEVRGHKDRKRFGVWWDTDILADEVAKLSRYYGECTVISEWNQDKGLIELLKLEAIPQYQRVMFNRREQVRTKAYGWVTDPRTRPRIIEHLAKCIREDEIDIRSMWTVDECKNFVVKPSGRAEAAQGKHDDQVLSLAIGLLNIDEATTFHERMTDAWIPPDLRDDYAAKQRASGGNQWR